MEKEPFWIYLFINPRNACYDFKSEKNTLSYVRCSDNMGKRSKEVVSYNMSRIRSKDTQLERKLEEIVKKIGLDYEKHYKLVGKPDFVFPKLKIALFADSHFWHGYNWNDLKKTIKTNRDFWIKKIERNIERDREVNETLQSLGWNVIRFWEHEIFRHPEDCLKKILGALANRREGK